MVQVGPAGGPVAAGEHASAVPEGDGAADAGGPDAGGAADVQGFAGGAEDGGDDVAVAQQPPGLGGADGHPGRVEGGLPEPPGEGVVLDLLTELPGWGYAAYRRPAQGLARFRAHGQRR